MRWTVEEVCVVCGATPAPHRKLVTKFSGGYRDYYCGEHKPSSDGYTLIVHDMPPVQPPSEDNETSIRRIVSSRDA